MSNQFFELHIKGKVQGVWFRKFCAEEAKRLGIKGYVKNMKDGSVYCEAEGDIENLIAFIEWCEVGPKLAMVDSVLKVSGAPKGFSDFEIRY